VLQSTLAALGGADESAAPPTPPDTASLKRLLALLESGDAEAERLFHALREGLQGRLGGERFRALSRAIAQFEFDAARGIVRGLLEDKP